MPFVDRFQKMGQKFLWQVTNLPHVGSVCNLPRITIPKVALPPAGGPAAVEASGSRSDKRARHVLSVQSIVPRTPSPPARTLQQVNKIFSATRHDVLDRQVKTQKIPYADSVTFHSLGLFLLLRNNPR